MITAQQRQLSELLEQVAKSLDIPDELYVDAVSKYEDISHWIEEQDEKENRREPEIYSQGSFCLGTVIRPLKGDYDIDLVYERDLRKNSVSQEQLKAETGDHLRSYVNNRKKSYSDAPTLKEGCRCWTLDYPNQFHMDVLPAIPDDDGRKSLDGHSTTSILVTDRDLHEWQPSNPKGYAEWFKGRMVTQFREKRAALATEMAKAAENVPEYKVKTPLQRAIQILKRHRDVFFGDDDDKPISIIITTLAANSYDNQADLIDAMLTLVRDMPTHIEVRYEKGKRVAWVPNPVNEKENFAERWEKHPKREEKFREWLKKVNKDLTTALKGGGIHKVVDLLGGVLGSSVVTKAVNILGDQTRQQRDSGNLKMASGSGILGATGAVKVKEHTFYGVDEKKDD